MIEEIIERKWRFVYSNTHEYPFNYYTTTIPDLEVKEKNCTWIAVHLFWRFYWVTSIKKQVGNIRNNDIETTF